MSKEVDQTLSLALKRAGRRLIRVLVKPGALINEYSVAPDRLGPYTALTLFIIASTLRSYLLFTKLGGIPIAPSVVAIEAALSLVEGAALIFIPLAFLALVASRGSYRKFVYISMYMLFALAFWRFLSSIVVASAPGVSMEGLEMYNKTYAQMLYLGLEKWGRENFVSMVVSRILGDVVPSIWGIVIQSFASTRVIKARSGTVFMVVAAWIAVEMIFMPVVTAVIYGLPMKG